MFVLVILVPCKQLYNSKALTQRWGHQASSWQVLKSRKKPPTVCSPATSRSFCAASFLGKSISLILQSHRNLSQLPNFAFSVPLAYFFLSQQEERSELELSQAQERAAQLIQLALIMFPSGKSVPTGTSVPAGFVPISIGESTGWFWSGSCRGIAFANGVCLRPREP